MRNKAIDILLIEDNQAEIDLMIETFEESKFAIHLNTFTNGEEAIKYLKREGDYKDAVTPDLILLDLNLPKKDGREVLADIKQNKSIKHIPVVILTSSSAEEDIAKTYAAGANCYVTKPVGIEQFMKVVQCIEQFWFTIVKLPTSSK